MSNLINAAGYCSEVHPELIFKESYLAYRSSERHGKGGGEKNDF